MLHYREIYRVHQIGLLTRFTLGYYYPPTRNLCDEMKEF